MKKGPKRMLFPDRGSALSKCAVPAMLNTFSLGIQQTSTLHVLQGVGVLLISSPVMFIVTCILSPLRLLGLILGTWLTVRIGQLGVQAAWLVFGVGFVFFYFRELMDFLREYGFAVLVFLSGGSFLRWLCAGNLSGDPFRQMILASEPCVTLVTTLVEAIPKSHRIRYDAIGQIVTDGNLSEEEALASLEQLISTPIGNEAVNG